MSDLLKQIITLPNPHLREPSKRVGVVNKTIKQLIGDMEGAVIEWEESRAHEVGVALAAIQIDKPLRIIVVRNNYDNKEDKTFAVFINPTITKYEGVVVEDFEGCLSIKDIYGKVPRYTKVRIKATGINGREFRLTAEGFLARILQHEIDHTKGIVFVDHIKSSSEAFFKLNEEGNLEALDYDQDIRNSDILW